MKGASRVRILQLAKGAVTSRFVSIEEAGGNKSIWSDLPGTSYCEWWVAKKRPPAPGPTHDTFKLLFNALVK